MANECIPLYRPGADLTTLTTAAVTGKTFVSISGGVNAATGGLISVATATAATKAFGVAVADAASGARVAVITGPGQVVPVTAGGTITAGQEVEVGGSGRAVVLASGKAAGLAVSAGTSGNDVFVRLY
jgi:hypothetical protein